jgi:periplasmic divalent cation tolerance protein
VFVYSGYRGDVSVNEYIEVLTTTETKEQAEKIAEALVDRRMAGCVQIIGPITSIYHWKGTREKAEEWLCLIKTKAKLHREVEKTIEKMHTYETPEIISVPIVSGSKKYLQWLDEELETNK